MQQTEQSKAEWDQFRNFEVQKHKWFLYWYPKLGMRVVEDIFDDTKTNDYDVVVEYKGKVLKIDEKARQKDYGDILVEVEQDTGSPGWLYKEIDGVFYASWGDPLAVNPTSAYMINLPEFRNLYDIIKHTMKEGVSTKGYGRSIFKTIAPDGLISMGVATKVL